MIKCAAKIMKQGVGLGINRAIVVGWKVFAITLIMSGVCFGVARADTVVFVPYITWDGPHATPMDAGQVDATRFGFSLTGGVCGLSVSGGHPYVYLATIDPNDPKNTCGAEVAVYCQASNGSWGVSAFGVVDGWYPGRGADLLRCNCPPGSEWDPSGSHCTVNRKNFDEPSSCPARGGNPIDARWGNKIQREVDYSGSGGLSFARTYNSKMDVIKNYAGSILLQRWGGTWHGTYDRAVYWRNNAQSMAAIIRSDGARFNYTTYSLYTFTPDETDAPYTLSGIPGGGFQVLNTRTDEVERYDANGTLLSITSRSGVVQTLMYSDGTTSVNGGFVLDASGNPTSTPLPAGLLIRVIDSFGHQLRFGYDNSSHVVRLDDPIGGVSLYTYDTSGNLISVNYPTDTGTAQRQYLYNEAAYVQVPAGMASPHLLTGIVAEDGQRFATFQYNAAGDAMQTEHAGAVERVSFSYSLDSDHNVLSATVTDALGKVRTQNFQSVQKTIKVTSNSDMGTGQCGIGKNFGYDANGNVSSKTDFNGNITNYSYDLSRNLETSRTEAHGTLRARTITTQWHASYRLPTLISVYAGETATGTPLQTTAYTYDASGNALTKTVSDPINNVSRTWTFTYNNFGQVLTVDGPRTDVDDITTYTYYNCTTGYECGQVQSITDALGHVTTFNSYNAAGQPLSITDPNGVITLLTYDARQRLTSRTVGTEVSSFSYYPTGLLQQVTLPDGSFLHYGYDDAHRLTQIQDNTGNKIVYTLDAMGNRTTETVYESTNTVARTHTRVFNALSQLYQEINAANTAAVTTTFGYDANGHQTTINAPMARNSSNTYDELNRLTQVTDPNLGLTKYNYDTNDNLVQVTDPKNLSTVYTYNNLGDLTQLQSPDTATTTNTFDSAGNLKTSTDARAQTVTYSYDATNRVTQASYSDQTITYSYDSGANAQGRLTQVTDASGSTSYTYTPQGRVASKTQVMGTLTKAVNYGYNAAGQLSTITTPSGQTITLTYSNNQVQSLIVNSTTVLSAITYSPFGPPTHWTWGNGTSSNRNYDQDGYLTNNQSAGTTSFTYNPDGSIASQTLDSSANLNLPTGTTNFTVSSTSNQLQSATGTFTQAYSYDNAGHITRDGTRTFTYNGAGRLSTATNAGVTTAYTYNALGQRVKKSNATSTSYFVYDEAGHLLGEYDQSGNLIQELVWLGDIPVATIRTDQGGSGVGVFYIHTDHLNAPSKITRPADNAIIWRWDHDPYGNGTPNEDPDGNGLALNFNVRFPGQYYDSETGLHYNYYRDCYDPSTGRYCQSDPIGLKGGVNTYAYVFGNPVANVDPEGLDVTIGFFPGTPGHVGIGVNLPTTYGLYPKERGISVVFCRDVVGIVQNDQANHDTRTNSRARYLTIQTSFAQDILIQRYIDRARTNASQEYNLCSNQCTGFVREALRAGGVGIPADANDVIVPSSLFDALEHTYGPPGKRK